MKGPAIFAFLLAPVLLAQGPLTPPGAPAPTMKSLQEIWDRLVAVEAQNTSLLGAIERQQALLTQQSAVLTLLADSQGYALPWERNDALEFSSNGASEGWRYISHHYMPDGRPAYSCYDAAAGNLLFVVRSPTNPNKWVRTEVDSLGDVGSHSSLNILSNGTVQIAYYDATNANLKFAQLVGETWTISVVESGGDVGQYCSLAPRDSAIAFYDATNGNLKYATRSGAGWSSVIVDSTGNVGAHCSMSFFLSSQPFIAYHDATNGDLKVARRTAEGNPWIVTTLDAPGTVGLYNSLAMSRSGKVGIAYFDDTNNRLRYASWDGADWSLATVDASTAVGKWCSLAFSPGDLPTISYYDSTNADLKFAALGNLGWRAQVVDSTLATGYWSSLAYSPAGEASILFHDFSHNDVIQALRKVPGTP